MWAKVGFSWVAVTALGLSALACGSADSPGQVNKGGTAPTWLPGEDEGPFPAEDQAGSDNKNLSTGGAGGGAARNGTGGAGGAQAPAGPLALVCPAYDPSLYSHTLTASARDPGNTASATRARELLSSGQTPLPGAVRAADFVNYFARTPPANAAADGLGGTLELRPRKIEGISIPTQFDLYVGIVAGAVSRPQVFLTLVVDSTLTPSALERAQATITGLANGLKQGDHVALISSEASVAEKTLSANVASDMAQLADLVTLSSGTVAARLAGAYEKAKTFPPGTWNRVVVLSDGEEDANLPNYALIEEAAANSGIFLSAIGLSPESDYGDALLYRLSHQGRGRYLYVDHANEPGPLFSTRFDEIFGIARDKVRIRVDLPSYMRSLDAEPTGGGGGSPRDKYLAPGEWARFVFHLSICSKDVLIDSILASQQLTVTVDSTLADGKTPTEPLALSSLPLKKYTFGMPTPELDKMVAIQSFVEVLRYPTDSRFQDAKLQLEALTSSPGPELLALLGQHPSFPKP